MVLEPKRAVNTYIEFYQQMHSEGHFAGNASHDGKFIKPIVDHLKIKSILDFGCGKGRQYFRDKLHEKYFNGVMPTLYDPGVPKISSLPNGTFDLVMSTDVLEHVPEEGLDIVLEQIFSRARLAVYLAISTQPAIAKLPTGGNAHVTVKPASWWAEKLAPFARPYTVVICRSNPGEPEEHYNEYTGKLVLQNYELVRHYKGRQGTSRA